MSVKLINTIDLVTCALISLAGGYLVGFTGATIHHKRLLRTSQTSNDPTEDENKTEVVDRPRV